MASLLHRLGRWAAAHARRVLLGWVVLLLPAFAPYLSYKLLAYGAPFLVLLVLGIVVSQLMTITVARPLNRLVGGLQRMSRGAIDAEIAEAVEFAEAGTWEDVADLTKDVLTPAGGQTR